MKNRKSKRKNLCGVVATISLFLLLGTIGGLETFRIGMLPGIGMALLFIGAFAFFAWLGGAWQFEAPKKGARR